MHKIYKTLFSLIFISALASVQAQVGVSFSDSTHIAVDTEFTSGVAVAIVDMNNDGLDDIIRLRGGKILQIAYQQTNGNAFELMTMDSLVSGREWALWVADVDNDGLNDIMASGSYNQSKLVRQIAPDEFELELLPNANHFAQGSNSVDINNDGFIDIFSCHDDAESIIWGNDRTGNFKLANDWIDMKTTPQSDNSGNYGSVWTDIDNDGDMDLYIAKCRLDVNSQNDPRRINALYINYNGRFLERAEERGLKFGYQSWTSDFQDIDNDGDLDCFITNHDFDVQILENNGYGYFTDITASTGVDFTGFILQGLMRDMDNDGYVDILTSGVEKYFHNNGDNTFTEVNNPFGLGSIASMTIGDLNNDGFLDVYGTHHQSYNNPTNIPDEIWMNDGNDNNFLAVTLKGTKSNYNGIGARLELHGPWGIQCREVRSGESYGIMTPFKQHFGMADQMVADSLIIKWPSGSVDVLYDVQANQFIEVEEGSTCDASEPVITGSAVPYFCTGTDSYPLVASNGNNYVWSTGNTGEVFEATQTGVFTVANYEGSCAVASDYYILEEEPDLSPEITVEGNTTLCEGDEVVLTASESINYVWSDTEFSQSITVSESGVYSVYVHGQCLNYYSEEITIDILEAETPEAIGDTLYGPGEATLVAIGDNPHWYDSEISETALFVGDTLITAVLEETTNFYVEDVVTAGGLEETTGMPTHTGNPFSSNIYNGETIFNVYEALTLSKVTVFTDLAGLRIIELQDADGNVLETYEVDIPSAGTYTLDLNFEIPEGENYVLTTNTENNNTVLGYNSPRLRRNNNGVSYPYAIDDVIEITGSNLGAQFYYYFYNWRVQSELVSCPSERIPVEALLVADGVAEAAESIGIQVFPNPSSGNVKIELPISIQSEVKVFVLDGLGKTHSFLNMGIASQSTLDLSKLPKGMYYIRFETDDKMYYSKIILQ